jgi:FkbM family methyltransferase
MLDRLVGPGDVVVEAGANIGAHSVPLARRVGTGGAVHAFEPQHFVFCLLAANLALNELPQGYAHHAALGTTSGTIDVPPLDYGRRNNFGGLSLDGMSTARILEGTRSEPVRLMTVDSLGLERLRLLKIDVEGMERAVLLGARDTIRRCRPLLYFEADRKERNEALFSTAFELGYRLWWHLAPLFNPRNFAGNTDNVFPRMVSFNVLGVPREVDLGFVSGKEVTRPSEVWPFD